MDNVQRTPDTRLLQWILRGVPIVLMLAGFSMACFFGWSYLQQTIFINDHAMPAYQADTRDTQHLWSPKPQSGTKIGDLLIPSLHIKVPIIEGAEPDELKHGAGHYSGSALPGEGSNVYLAGHRDTVFMKLKDLHTGERIQFASAYGTFTYEVTGFKIVPAAETSVLLPTKYETLTLQTCYPFSFIGSAPDRYIVQTKFIARENAS